MIKQIKQSKDKVAYLLHSKPALRDNDMLLILEYYIQFHNIGEFLDGASLRRLKAFLLQKNVPSFESIRRNRQRYNQEGLYIGKSYQPAKAKEVKEELKRGKKK